MAVLSATGIEFEATVPIIIIGAGACGLTAALAAHDQGAEVVVLERDSVPQGSTALSSGMIPACNTKIQRARKIDDSVEIMMADILSKAHGETDHDMARHICEQSGPTIDWLCDDHAIELTLVEGFLYPNHSKLRMHAPLSRQGADLVGSLTRAVERAGIDIITDAHVTDLYAAEDNYIAGLSMTRPDGTVSRLGCKALILACNGFGGNPEMVARFIPEMAEGSYFGHTGNQGDAIDWGEALGAATADLGSFQGHGSVAHPHGILISWALMMEGGIQVNKDGKRFSNEHQGYSEQARRVMAQPDGKAWCIYDARLHKLGQDFDDYLLAEQSGAIRSAQTTVELAALCGLDPKQLKATMQDVDAFTSGNAIDDYGRDFTTKPVLTAPYYAIQVTGSLFHTQGGLVVDDQTQVLTKDGSPLPNLYAGGGAARGLSGPSDWGYLSGNGLLAATVLGRLSGHAAAKKLTLSGMTALSH